MTTTSTDLERALRWRRRGLAIALAVAVIMLAAVLGGPSQSAARRGGGRDWRFKVAARA